MSTPEESVKRFSYSKLLTLTLCPLRFKYRYIDKLPVEVEPQYATILGVTIHKALELFFPTTREYDQLSTLWNYVCYDLVEEEDRGNYIAPYKDPRNTFLISEKEKRIFFNHGMKILDKYYHSNKHVFLADNYKLIKSELPFEVKFKDWLLSGFIDKVEQQGKDVFICDYKSGSKIPSQEEIEVNLQATFYSIAYRMEYKRKEAGLYFHYLRTNTIRQTVREKKHFDDIATLLDESTKLVLSGKLDPTPSTEACKWCDYRSICPAIKTKGNKNEKNIIE